MFGESYHSYGNRPVLGARPVKRRARRTDQWPKAEASTERLVEEAAARLARAGSEVREVEAFAGLATAQAVIMSAEAAAAFRQEREQHDAQLSDRFRSFLLEGEACPPQRLREARERAEQGRREAAGVFAEVDALVTLGAAGQAPQGLETTGDPSFCRVWTQLGCPCISLPVLAGPAGLPVGLQLVGTRGADDRLLAVAAWVERELSS